MYEWQFIDWFEFFKELGHSDESAVVLANNALLELTKD
jgi:hypothetical protein